MITGKTLQTRGWPQGRLIGRAKGAAAQWQAAGLDEATILNNLDAVREAPDHFLDDAICGELAAELVAVRKRAADRASIPVLHEAPLPYRVWGAEQIDPGALAQMDNAMRLPVTVTGALMPDAHVGYGLPIGGVLATENAVIPYAVGVDIACRMRLSVYAEAPELLERAPQRFERALLDKTFFGAGVQNALRPDHPVLEDPAWKTTGLLQSLRGTAVKQLGTSGTGNHFVEWGALTVTDGDSELHVPAGTYIALLSHSGSRGVGFKIANAYSTLAMQTRPTLERDVRHLAWLMLDSEAGQEYWEAMELAGRFASANHAVIHRNVARALGFEELASVENHHNFAWQETVGGPDGRSRQVIVHRKGATPAGNGVLGVIPGSMADPGYVVRGRGVAASLDSASHGAGRAMSRRQALDNIPRRERDTYLANRGVRLLGGGLDESPQAYKRVEAVLAAQTELVDVLARFEPRIVRMADEPGDI